MSAIFNLIKFNFFRTYPSLKPQFLVNSNGLAIWHEFIVNKHIYKYIETAHLLDSNGLAIWLRFPDITHI